MASFEIFFYTNSPTGHWNIRVTDDQGVSYVRGLNLDPGNRWDDFELKGFVQDEASKLDPTHPVLKPRAAQ